jgi:serine/threonine protein kinase
MSMIGKILSHYRILKEIGRGGMGIVYLGEDIKLKRNVALKLLHELDSDPDIKTRFFNEARTASSLDHPNICSIFEIDETADGLLFIAMAYYEGITLRQKLDAGPLPILEGVEIALQVVEGLKYAHAHGVIHRDIKPANIIISNGNIVKIMDFGLAKFTAHEGTTREGTFLGTLAYATPESLTGEIIDHRADIWSFGVMLYEILTGIVPFSSEYEAGLIYSILNESPSEMTEIRPGISPELERIVLKCLSKDIDHRYATSDELLIDLIDFSEMPKKVSPKPIPKKERESKGPERRLATVLFAEIMGYRGVSKKMEDEDVAAFTSDFYRSLASVGRKFGGRVDQMAADSYRILFGVPSAVENAPQKALNTAIDSIKILEQLRQKVKLDIPMGIRIGINSGRMIVGIMGASQEEYSVIGDPVDVALKLKETASAGNILVGPLTYRFTKNDFKFQKLDPVQLSEKTGLQPVYRLISMEEELYRAGSSTDRMIFSDLVGRDKELRTLKIQILKLIDGEGSIVNLIGEAGLGKSRLIDEIKKSAETRQVTFLVGRSLSFGRNLSFHPIIDIVNNWARIQQKEDSAISFHKLETAIRRLFRDKTEDILPFIATFMKMKLHGKYAERVKDIEGEALEKLILKSLKELIMRASGIRPLVLVFEDIHWADMTTIGLLESLFDLVKDHPILFINVFRPNYKETGDRISRTVEKRYHPFLVNILLSPLNEWFCGTLITNLLQGKSLPPGIQGLITRKAGGNPFFIEEVTRSFIDDGVIVMKSGQLVVTDRINAVVIPETIEDVIMARMDKLDEQTRSLLKIASVIGRNFLYEVIANVAVNIDAINEKLAFLKAVELIREREKVQKLEYSFRHAIAQEVAYESILVKRRKELHIQIAHAIESLYSDKLHDFYGMLAFHYSRGEELDKAEDYLVNAGEEALRSSASNEALNYYRDALDLYLQKRGSATDPSKLAMFERNIALALYNHGQDVEAVQAFKKALAFYGEAIPKSEILRMLKFVYGFLVFIISIYFQSLRWKKLPEKRDNEIALLTFRKCLAYGNTNPRKMFVESFYILRRLSRFDLSKVENGMAIGATASILFSWPGISFRLSRKILGFIKDKMNPEDFRSVFSYRLAELFLKFFTGDWQITFDHGLVERNLKVGEIRLTSMYINLHTQILTEKGDRPQAEAFISRLKSIYTLYDHDLTRAYYCYVYGRFLVRYRELNLATQEMDQGIIFAEKAGFKPTLFALYSFKARIHAYMGDLEQGRKMLIAAQQMMPQIDLVPLYRMGFLISRMVLELLEWEHRADLPEDPARSLSAKDMIRSAVAVVKTASKVASDCTEAYRLAGIAYWLTGREGAAFRLWERSIREGNRIGARIELSRTYEEIARRLKEKTGRYSKFGGISAEAWKEKAEELFGDS